MLFFFRVHKKEPVENFQRLIYIVMFTILIIFNMFSLLKCSFFIIFSVHKKEPVENFQRPIYIVMFSILIIF
jgi:hypothetical protein